VATIFFALSMLSPGILLAILVLTMVVFGVARLPAVLREMRDAIDRMK
jgi:Sec-independent protein translocase protein TatA